MKKKFNHNQLNFDYDKLMEIKLTPQESEEYFHNALCNAVSTGYMDGYGLELEWDEAEYELSRKKLTSPCIEDVWMQMLRDGYKLTFVDNESEGDMTRSISMKEVHERVSLIPASHILNLFNENDDVETADCILQFVFWKEIVFG